MFAADVNKLRRESRSLNVKRWDKPGRIKPLCVADWVWAKIDHKGDMTLDAPVIALDKAHGLTVHRTALGRALHRLGLSHKISHQENLQTSEQARPEMNQKRRIRRRYRQSFMPKHLERFTFLDETWLKTPMIKTPGWAAVGERLVYHAPFGHWHT